MALVKIDSLVRRDVSNKNKVDATEVLRFAYSKNLNIYCKFEPGDIYSAAHIPGIKKEDNDSARKMAEPIKRSVISYLLVNGANIDEILSCGKTQVKEFLEGLEVDGEVIRRYRGVIRNFVPDSENKISPTKEQVESKLKEIAADNGIYMFNKGDGIAKGRIFQEVTGTHWLEGALLKLGDAFDGGSAKKEKSNSDSADINKDAIYEMGYIPRYFYQYKFYIYRNGAGENNPNLFKPDIAPDTVFLKPDQLYIEVEDLKDSEYDIKRHGFSDSKKNKSNKETKISVTDEQVENQVDFYLKNILKIEKEVIKDYAIRYLDFLEVYVEEWLKTAEGSQPLAKAVKEELKAKGFMAEHAQYMAALTRTRIKDGRLDDEPFKKEGELVPWKETGLVFIENGVKRLLNILGREGDKNPERLKAHIRTATVNYLKETDLEERRYSALIYKMLNIFRGDD